MALGRAPRGLSEPLVWRRGPTTGPRHVQTATTRFRREDRLRLEFATRLDATPQARLVDRTGSPLQVPVAATSRADTGDEGLRWVVAEVTLAPLAAGDYEIELELAGGVSHELCVQRRALRPPRVGGLQLVVPTLTTQRLTTNDLLAPH